MKRIFATIGFSTILLLSGCIPSIGMENDKAIHENEESGVETVMIPDVQLKDDFYKTLLPFKKSASRGVTASNINSKFDMQEAEEGLLRISHQTFNPSTHYFQEGQYIDKETANTWLSRSSFSKGGLNPPLPKDANNQAITDKTPQYLSHIIEQNYLTMTEDKKVRLSGISIGLALNSITYTQKGEEVQIPDKTIEQQGKKMADEIVKRLRAKEGLQEIPIVVGLFKQVSQNSITPGTYFARATAENGQTAVSDWTAVDESHFILPAATVVERTKEINSTFTRFKKEIDEYFPSFVNAIGTASFEKNEVSSLRIEIPIQFQGTNETAGFAHYVSDLTTEFFPEVYTEVKITSPNGPEALIVKQAKGKSPFVHVYGHLIPEDLMKNGSYQTVQPFKMSASRGLIVPNVFTKYDMKEVEEGLLRISMSNFSPKTHDFQEGQYIDKKLTQSWLARSSADKDGLNPAIKDGMSDKEIADKAPLYLAHIIEQDYVTVTDDKKQRLSGISIGLVMNSVYYTRSGNEAKIPDKVIEQEGMKMAEKIVARMRQLDGLQEIPIVVGLFKQQSRNSIVPGTYFATAVAGKGQAKPTAWKKVDELFITLPASSQTDNYRDLNTKYNNFKQDIDQYFPSYVNVVGTVFYKDSNLKSLRLEIPVQFYGRSEMIGFTQHLTSLITQYFSELTIEVNVISTNGPEVLIVNEGKGKEPVVHIYGY